MSFDGEAHAQKDMETLIHIIKGHEEGITNADGSISITFGVLFRDTANHLEALVCKMEQNLLLQTKDI